METNDKIKAEKNFNAIFHLYTANFFCVGVLAANINNIVKYLPTTASDIAMLAAIQLIVGIFSILFFGYYSDKISEKFSRKKVFLFSNFTIFLGFLIVALSVNYTMFLIFHILAAFGTGAFLPIGFAIIGPWFFTELEYIIDIYLGIPIVALMFFAVGYYLGLKNKFKKKIFE